MIPGVIDMLKSIKTLFKDIIERLTGVLKTYGLLNIIILVSVPFIIYILAVIFIWLLELLKNYGLSNIIALVSAPFIIYYLTPKIINRRISRKHIAEQLVEKLKDEKWDIRKEAAKALVEIGRFSIEPLCTLLKTENENETARWCAIVVLGTIGDYRAMETLNDIIKGDTPFQKDAIQALGLIGTRYSLKNIAAIYQRLKSGEADSLENIDARFTKWLNKKFEEGDPAKKKDAIKEMSRVKDTSVVKTLIDIITKARGKESEDVIREADKVWNTILADNDLINEAIAEFRKTTAENPDDFFAHFYLGSIYHKIGRLDEAIKEYEEAVRINPEDSYARNSLGAALYNKGLTDEAIAEYEEAARINPGYSYAHYNLGVAYKQKGLMDEAIKEYKEAARINSEHSILHYYLGKALKEKGLKKEAEKAFEDCIRAPQYRNKVKEAEKELEELKGE
jgi:tetratricopeptide (TPR) repeat protein